MLIQEEYAKNISPARHSLKKRSKKKIYNLDAIAGSGYTKVKLSANQSKISQNVFDLRGIW
jgi:hypothetical protein